MVCIYCGYSTAVTNSRLQKKQNQVWRRRQCAACKAVFTTLEKPDFLSALSVRDKNDYAPFYRDKLLLSIHDSLKHRKTALRDATALTDTVISKLYPLITGGTISRVDIATSTAQVLKRFDKAATTYYLAYHPGSL